MTTTTLPLTSGTRVLTDDLERRGPFAVPADIGPRSAAVLAARGAWRTARAAEGLTGAPDLLTPPSAQAKLGKGDVPLWSVTLAPSDSAGLGFTTCGAETVECRSGCVLTAGRGRFSNVRVARRARTRLLATDPQAFVVLVALEATRAARKAGTIGLRLNAASYIRWERVAPDLLKLPGVVAYDYTKHADRDAGYAVTFSVSERRGSLAQGLARVAAGGTATVVLDVPKGRPLPDRWVGGLPMIDGDVHDFRAADPAGVWVGLRAKGDLIGAPAGGFVYSADPTVAAGRLEPAAPRAA